MAIKMLDKFNSDRYSVLLAIGIPSMHWKHLVSLTKSQWSLQCNSPIHVHIKPLVNRLKEYSCFSIACIKIYCQKSERELIGKTKHLIMYVTLVPGVGKDTLSVADAMGRPWSTWRITSIHWLIEQAPPSKVAHQWWLKRMHLCLLQFLKKEFITITKQYGRVTLLLCSFQGSCWSGIDSQELSSPPGKLTNEIIHHVSKKFRLSKRSIQQIRLFFKSYYY